MLGFADDRLSRTDFAEGIDEFRRVQNLGALVALVASRGLELAGWTRPLHVAIRQISIMNKKVMYFDTYILFD